jgi:uncharacterized membrane protein YfcA
LSSLLFTLIVFGSSFAAGLLGALTGLGGGVIIIPLLTLGFGINIKYAVGTSLIAVIATSSGAAASYVKNGISNIRIGMFLEIATTIGAISGAHIAGLVSTEVVAVTFGIVLIFSAFISGRRKEEFATGAEKNKTASYLRLNGKYTLEQKEVQYTVKNVPGGFGVMYIAGALSGLLGIGSGAFKVIAMDYIMKLPFRVSTTTSNFMIGVTAAASAGIYLQKGYIDPGLSMPVVLGVLPGALIGSKLLVRFRTKWLRIMFAIVITILGIEMIANGISGNLR